MAKQKSSKSNASGNDAKQRPLQGNRVVYSEFGDYPSGELQSNRSQSDALERAVPNLPPNQQNLRVQTSRKGRGGKTVTVISGFQASSEVLTALVKTLKTQCGTGGTVKENEIEIQGDHKQKLVEILVKLGYKAKASGG